MVILYILFVQSLYNAVTKRRVPPFLEGIPVLQCTAHLMYSSTEGDDLLSKTWVKCQRLMMTPFKMYDCLTENYTEPLYIVSQRYQLDISPILVPCKVRVRCVLANRSSYGRDPGELPPENVYQNSLCRRHFRIL